MFGRRTRTRLPTPDILLSTPSAHGAQDALTASKQRQASYYNRTAKERPTLPVGQTVRVRYDDRDWRKAEVARVLPHRSYEVHFKDGTTRRRTSRHVRFSSEPPVVIRSDDGGDTAATGPQTVARDAAKPADHQARPRRVRREHGKQRATPSSAGESTKKPVTTTPLGRVVKQPARFND